MAQFSWEPSFPEYLMTCKAENTIIPQETIHSIEQQLTNGNIQWEKSVLRDTVKNIDDIPINIAVMGKSGAGKSSFINALREAGPEEEGAAEVGIGESTMERIPYKYLQIETLYLWKLPGIETMDFQRKYYLEKAKFQEYDFFIIIFDTCFTKLELDLARKIKLMNKNFYFVRTKVDIDFHEKKEVKLDTFDREKSLQQMRSDYMNTLCQNDMDAPLVFLISNHHSYDYDFSFLRQMLKKEAPVQKRYSTMLFLHDITGAAIERNRDSIKETIWKEASMRTIWKILPLVGTFLDSDVKKQKEILNQYRVHFGVDNKSLEFIAKDTQVPVERLKKKLTSPGLSETEKEETFTEMLLKFGKNIGSTLFMSSAIPHYYRKFYNLQLQCLNIVTEDAKVLLKETYLRN
ncbi:interferon-inducible GTPase 1-like [Peromyscus maniculatus bairdii]|uniref:interferon-inducible GTPase 1-like n=1 Tax=Peromyscus maniculatus bairdii TaxID=230844 RepID=UPI00042A980F|nr:interferon-inducible GTPase 1-like [Peromyscus maniculatus bairdii]